MKSIIWFLVGIVIIGFSIGIYMYNKPVADIDEVSHDIEISATALFEAFETDEAAANQMYLDKVILVSGSVVSITDNGRDEASVTLETGSPLFGVSCSIDSGNVSAIKSLKIGDQVKIKGWCTGMLMDVVLNRCTVVE
jgi:hypothetical protein